MQLTRRAALGSLVALGVTGCAASTGMESSRVPSRAPGVPEPIRLTYGEHASQFGELWLPAGDGPVRGVVMVLHGGFWMQSYGLELGRPLAADLANAGLAAWNVEYRRLGGGGGWPATFQDVAAALDTLADAGQRAAGGRLDLARVVSVGHSAGGHLATWLAARPKLPPEIGGGGVVRLHGVVSQAGVLDLVAAALTRVGGSVVPELLGGRPDEVPERYAMGSPAALVPHGVRVVCVHGSADRIVPIAQSERYVSAASAAGDVTELDRLPGTDHFAPIDPASQAWARCRDAVLRLLG